MKASLKEMLTSKGFVKIPSLWEAAVETERRCFSKVILELNVTPNISRSSDFFSTVPPIINGGNWWCIGHHLDSIIVVILLAFSFISQRSLNSLTLLRSWFKDSATVTLAPGDGTTAIKVELYPHNRSAYSPVWKKGRSDVSSMETSDWCLTDRPVWHALLMRLSKPYSARSGT